MRIFAALIASLCCAAMAVAAPNFPPLTGRVVDLAHLLTPATQQGLDAQLAAYERQSSNQLVVATVPSLGGQSIEQYGYQLGRVWGIGQKDKNNGVLLLVAPTERKVRIEVGYGLEGLLTDAQSNQIIQSIILPAFKQGQMQQGIVQGVQAIETVLSGEAVSVPEEAAASQNQSSGISWFLVIVALFLFSQVLLFGLYVIGSILAFFLSLFGFDAFKRYLARQKANIFPADKMFLLWLLTPSSRLTGSGGGGFSGGGGSFGGGGSSGSW